MKTPSIEDVINAYNRFVPHQILHLMGKESVTDIELGESLELNMTILFSDMRGFTKLSESMTPRDNFRFINSWLERMEPVIRSSNGIIDKYIGDAIMALFPTNADDAVDAAIGMLGRLSTFNEDRRKAGEPPVSIGIGLNTGLMMLGTVGGRNRMQSTVISDAVNMASRIESMTKAYGIDLLISEHTYHGLRDPSRYRIRFADRMTLKGKEQPQSVYEVFDADPPKQRAAKQKTVRTFERAVAYYYFREVSKAAELFGRCLEQCPGDRLARRYLDRCEQFERTGIYEGTGGVDLSIVWSHDIELGHPEIDEQHRQLFASVNTFADMLKKDRDVSKAAPILDFLDNYVQVHFKTEEEVMEKAGYPFIDTEKEQHRSFSRDFSNLKREMQGDIDWYFLLFKIQTLVMDWLVHHTCKSDKRLGKFLKLEKEDRERSRQI